MLIYEILNSKSEDIDYLERIGIIFKSNDDRHFVLEKHYEHFKELISLRNISISYKEKDCLIVAKDQKRLYNKPHMYGHNPYPNSSILIINGYKLITLYTHINEFFRYVIVKDENYNIVMDRTESIYYCDYNKRCFLNYKNESELKNYYKEILTKCKNQSLFDDYMRALLTNNINIDLNEIDSNKKHTVLCPYCKEPIYSSEDMNDKTFVCKQKHDCFVLDNASYKIKKFFDFNFDNLFNQEVYCLYNINTKQIVINKDNTLIDYFTKSPIVINVTFLKNEWITIPLSFIM